MKQSKIYLLITTFILAIVCVATSKTKFIAHSGCIVTAGLTKVIVIVPCTMTNVGLGLCSYVTSGLHRTVLPVYTIHTCTIRLWSGA